MNRILLTISAAFIATIGFSQITITSADIGQAGDSMIVGNVQPATVMNVGATGSQTWSFNFQVDDYNTLVFEDPTNTASGTLFPGADMAIERQSDTLFFKINSTEMALDGLSGDVAGVVGVPLTLSLNIANDVTQIEFPSTYTDQFTDQATIDTIINCADIGASAYCTQARIKRRYLVTSNIDAYGPLETSGGEYANTIRQYYKERTIDSIWANLPVFGGPLSFYQEIDSTSHIYRWYANGEKWPVLTAYADAAGGDIVSAEFQIDNLLGYTESKNHPACNGDCNGSATVQGLGADPPYSYVWPASANNQTTATANGLCAGTYVVTITDNDTNTHELQVVLTNPTNVQITGSVQGVNFANDGAIDITPSGGAGNYTYAWSGPDGYTAATQDISGLAEGDYTVVVSDANGCDTSRLFSVIATGISFVNEVRFSMYPNPANNLLTLVCDANINNIKVSDLLGNVVINKKLSSQKYELEISGLSSGIYMVEVEANNSVQLKKLTIQH